MMNVTVVLIGVCGCLYVSISASLSCTQSPQYSSGSYDSIKTEVSASAEDLSTGRAQAVDDDDDEHDEHDDSDKITDTEGMDPERLKAFNVRA